LSGGGISLSGGWESGSVGEISFLQPGVAVLEDHVDGIWVLTSRVAVSEELR